MSEFYSSWDKEGVRKNKEIPRYKNAFQQDRENLITTSAFRRLQAKTQVFRCGTHLFRTRLTHSLEVAMVGRAICDIIHCFYSTELSSGQIDPNIVEFACLAHDLGNPPIGHKGEKKLNELMKNYGGFEGNAQTLRLLSDLIEWPKCQTPARASLDAIIKYSDFYSEKKDGKFLYDDQEDLWKKIRGVDSKQNQNLKSIECQIMDLADDIVNASADIVDGIRAKLITAEKVRAWWKTYDKSKFKCNVGYDSLIDWIETCINNETRQHAFVNLFASKNLVYEEDGKCEPQITLEAKEGDSKTETKRFNYTLHKLTRPKNGHEKGLPFLAEKIRVMKDLVLDLIIKNEVIQKKEEYGCFQIECVVRCLEICYCKGDAPSKLLVDSGIVDNERHKALGKGSNCKKMRHICDFVSGMTDSYLEDVFRKLEDPRIGIIGEISFGET